MSYISGARSLPDEQVRIASTKMNGIGPKKAIQLRYRLGISGMPMKRSAGSTSFLTKILVLMTNSTSVSSSSLTI